MTKQTIPAFSLARQVKNMRPQFMAALEKVLDSQQFIGGTFIESFEKALAQYLGAQYVISCNSGTDALYMALQAFNMPANAIVLTTPFSFMASSSEIVASNAHPVFIDIDPYTLNIDPKLVTEWLNKEAIMHNGQATHKATGFPIVGILPVDIFGQCADFTALNAIAQKWNLWTVEDCAQAIGASLNGKKACTLGTIGTLSFYPTKNLGAFGDAGACATNDPVLADKLLEVRNHGRKKNYEYTSLGINSRLDAFQAVILSEKLNHIDAWNERRRAIANRYHQGLKNLSFIQLPYEKVGTHVYHQYSIIVNDQRNMLEKHLAERGVQTRIFYPQSLPTFDFLRTHPALITACHVSEVTTRNVMSLPMWPEMTDAEVDYVIESIQQFSMVTSTTQNIKTTQASL